MKTVVLTVVVLVALGVLAWLALMYSGVGNVGADYPDNPLVAWALSTASDRSIDRHAKGQPTIDLNAADAIGEGAGHYKAMCEVCHGTPAGQTSPISKGLNPQPPDLKEAGEEWAPAKIHWVVKHGIRMTGMPAFGKTHDEDDLWRMVAFVRKYPSLTPETYRQTMSTAPARESFGEEGAMHGMMMPGMPMPGMPMPGVPMPGMPMPGAHEQGERKGHHE